MSPMTSRALTLAVSGLALWFRAETALAAPAPPPLPRHPTLSRLEIVFSFAGDLWSVPRGGGRANRLTTGPGVKTDPVFSPDGRRVAFTGDYGGNQDVYVIPSSGGEPRRMT